MKSAAFATLLWVVLIAACGGEDNGAPASATSAPTPTVSPTASPVAVASDCTARGFSRLAVGDVVEAPFACIGAPLPGARVMGAIEVSGWSAGAFEASLVVDVLDGDGAMLSRVPVTVAQPEIGLFVGRYRITVPIADTPRFDRGRIHVWAQSPRDGGIMFDTAVEVVFSP
jgi:hypothetical protein